MTEPLVTIIEAGSFASIQDGGRFGYRHLGVPQCGVMDRAAFATLNHNLGNPLSRAAIELGPCSLTLSVNAPVTLSYQGSCHRLIHRRSNASTSKMLIPSTRIILDQGDTLELRYQGGSLYGYLGVRGRFALPKVLGSYSTDIQNGFGGFEGRTLKPGDQITLTHTNLFDERTQGATPHYRPKPISRCRVIVNEPRLWPLLAKGQLTLLPQLSRMGLKLSLSKLHQSGLASAADEGERETKLSQLSQTLGRAESIPIFPGAIQLPPDGNPVILMRDCQTSGGYPVIGYVIERDLNPLSQLLPGSVIELHPIETATANALWSTNHVDWQPQ